jgi:hypothetical protein
VGSQNQSYCSRTPCCAGRLRFAVARFWHSGFGIVLALEENDFREKKCRGPNQVLWSNYYAWLRLVHRDFVQGGRQRRLIVIQAGVKDGLALGWSDAGNCNPCSS